MKVDLIEHWSLKSYTEPRIGWWSEHVPDEIGADVLERLRCLELRVAVDGLPLEASRLREDMVWALVQQGVGTPYLVKASAHMTARSRLKSYKGIFPRSWKVSPDDFVEEEIDRGSGSYLIGLARVVEADRQKGFYPDPLAAFLVISSHWSARTLWAEIGDNVTRAVTISGGHDSIYLGKSRLIPPMAIAGTALARVGGDQSGEFFNVAVFLSSAAQSTYAATFRQLGARLWS